MRDRVRDYASQVQQADPRSMIALLIGYVRVSTYEQDLTAQRVARERLGVLPSGIHTDHGLTGTTAHDQVSAKRSLPAETETPR